MTEADRLSHWPHEMLEWPGATASIASRMTLGELQQLIRDTFGAKDGRRGDCRARSCGSWRKSANWPPRFVAMTPEEATATEFADVLAWLATLANIAGVDLEEAVRAKYGAGCPECHRMPCVCGAAEKP